MTTSRPRDTVRTNVAATLESLWREVGFVPNDAQRRAILHTHGPLYLPAGPGSGKTRVLLWRTVKLIAFDEIPPAEIFLGTFTEKGAHQLREGLRALLAVAGARLRRQFDISRMAIGTIHSICRTLLLDRRLMESGVRPQAPVLLDELAQYRFVYRARTWDRLREASGLGAEVNTRLVQLFGGPKSQSRHRAVSAAIGFFNRLSEEGLDVAQQMPSDPALAGVLRMYQAYRELLTSEGKTDLSLLQWHAYERLCTAPRASTLFQHVIVDEYQDTNAIQEKIYFRLATGSRNLCVVGDDDQALYRFRGATVGNFLRFPEQCEKLLGAAPVTIPLVTNYRSRRSIVAFYNSFMARQPWTSQGTSYRVTKTIVANDADPRSAVAYTNPGPPAACAEEVAALVARLVAEQRVTDPNQIAFLFPSLGASAVKAMRAALEARGLEVYAPRAGSFMEQPESRLVFGLFQLILGSPTEHHHTGFRSWLESSHEAGAAAAREDRSLAAFVRSRQQQIARVLHDEDALRRAASAMGLDETTELADDVPQRLANASGLSDAARRFLRGGQLTAYLRHQRARRRDRPITVGYVINRTCSLDWGVLDLFYHLTAFPGLKHAFDLAQAGQDEGPICNLSQISDYLARFQAETSAVLTARILRDSRLVRMLFSSFLYTLYRREEGEYEDRDTPFPKGRVLFFTIHQAKGLEFPVVVLGNLRKEARARAIDKLVVQLGARRDEPEELAPQFDVARMFYVALSRAQQLLVLCPFQGPGQRYNTEFRELLPNHARPLAELPLTLVEPRAAAHGDPLRPYSFTGDYLQYAICPRRYMLERRYGFAPSRGQTTMFGSLVHRTIEDLHQYLIGLRQARAAHAGGGS